MQQPSGLVCRCALGSHPGRFYAFVSNRSPMRSFLQSSTLKYIHRNTHTKHSHLSHAEPIGARLSEDAVAGMPASTSREALIPHASAWLRASTWGAWLRASTQSADLILWAPEALTSLWFASTIYAVRVRVWASNCVACVDALVISADLPPWAPCDVATGWKALPIYAIVSVSASSDLAWGEADTKSAECIWWAPSSAMVDYALTFDAFADFTDRSARNIASLLDATSLIAILSERARDQRTGVDRCTSGNQQRTFSF